MDIMVQMDEFDSTLMLKGDYNGKSDLVKPKPRAVAQIRVILP
jgi:hypothetical protein